MSNIQNKKSFKRVVEKLCMYSDRIQIKAITRGERISEKTDLCRRPMGTFMDDENVYIS